MGTPYYVTPDVTFQVETLAPALAEAKPLLEAHWEEIAHWKDIPLDPRWDVYTMMEQQGTLRIFTLRDREGLKGYAVFIVTPHLHYRSSLQAVQDILYLDPALRGHLLGGRFMQWCDERLASEGVQVVCHHVKLAHDFSTSLRRLGYEQVESLWMRRLDRRG